MQSKYLKLPSSGTYLGRVWNPAYAGPSIVTIRDGRVVDLTSKGSSLSSTVCEMDDPVGFIRSTVGLDLGDIDEISKNPVELDKLHFLAPCDLQTIKACGVTFAGSMVERVIEEKAAGDPSKAEAIRRRVGSKIGENLVNIAPGSKKAEEIKSLLIEEGLWSQYLEVGIGPDAEVFTKCPVLASVGSNASVGLHPSSKWSNPEPEIVLAVNSKGKIVGCTLGNDVNLRDFEGSSALLLSTAKDINASSSIGPLIRLFDETFDLAKVKDAELKLRVEGEDGFILNGSSSMKEISREPEELVSQTFGEHHQYPDGFMLYLGTMFAPTQDRGDVGGGFTHKVNDKVTISCDDLGVLVNQVKLTTECPKWLFGIGQLMKNLSDRKLL